MINYARYGGRDITVCQRWLDSFEAFYADMGSKPSPKHSIERLDNEAGYFPENCIWATIHVQSRNTRVNHLLTYAGKTQCLQDWATEYGLETSTLLQRLRFGWTLDRALTKVPDITARDRKNTRFLTVNGVTRPLADWLDIFPIPRQTVLSRLAAGWPPEKALTVPIDTRKSSQHSRQRRKIPTG